MQACKWLADGVCAQMHSIGVPESTLQSSTHQMAVTGVGKWWLLSEHDRGLC
jgi:hypothetical protein